VDLNDSSLSVRERFNLAASGET